VVSFGNPAPLERGAHSQDCSDLAARSHCQRGALFAIHSGMAQDSYAVDQHSSGAALLRVMRAFGEASLVAIAFAFAILLLGLPFALFGRALHDVIAWIVGNGM
jgi:hypothetical protein